MKNIFILAALVLALPAFAATKPGGGTSSSALGNGIPTTASVTVFGVTNLLVDAGSGNYFTKELTNNFGLVFTNGTDKQVITVELVQDTTGRRTVAVVPNTAGSVTNDVAYSAETAAFFIPTNAAYYSKTSWRYHAADKRWRMEGIATGR